MQLKDSEFQFIKDLIEVYNLRLTRNNEHQTPYDLIRSYPKKAMPFRGVPNLRRDVWDYFETKIKENADLLDSESNEKIHFACIRGELGEVEELVGKDENCINSRNLDGKTPFMLAIEHERVEVANLLFQKEEQTLAKENQSLETLLFISPPEWVITILFKSLTFIKNWFNKFYRKLPCS